MKVLVTGSSGFLGSWICRVLTDEHKVVCLNRETSELTRILDLNDIEIIRIQMKRVSVPFVRSSIANRVSTFA